jgi:hypothetical protein
VATGLQLAASFTTSIRLWFSLRSQYANQILRVDFFVAQRRVGILKWGSGFVLLALEVAAQLYRFRMSVSEEQIFAHAHFAIEVSCVVTFL